MEKIIKKLFYGNLIGGFLLLMFGVDLFGASWSGVAGLVASVIYTLTLVGLVGAVLFLRRKKEVTEKEVGRVKKVYFNLSSLNLALLVVVVQMFGVVWEDGFSLEMCQGEWFKVFKFGFPISIVQSGAPCGDYHSPWEALALSLGNFMIFAVIFALVFQGLRWLKVKKNKAKRKKAADSK
jgi:hypothetical protein